MFAVFHASPFIVESILFFALPWLLFFPTLLNVSAQSLTLHPTAQQKKYFFFSLRFVQILLIAALVGDLVLDGSSMPMWHAGNSFFRQDKLSWFMNFFLTATTLYYTYLMAFSFSRTTTQISYIIELPFLILCTVLSLRLFIATNDFVLMIILLEIASFCSIIFLGSQSVSPATYSLSIEATIKYFIINAVAVALLLFAISGFFYLTTSTNMLDIASYFYQHPANCVFFTEQIIFFQFIFFFAYLVKLGAAPLHQWVPDVYEGAETLVTCFLVILIGPALLFKFICILKILASVPTSLQFLQAWLLLTGGLSIIIGTLGAFYQTRIKRFIAYSSIVHLGFMLLGISFNNFLGYFAFLFYIIIYVLTNIIFFTFLLFCQNYIKTTGASTRIIFINQLRVFIQTSVFFFFCLVVCLFSFAGIPPFAGFFAKFFVLSVLIQHDAWVIALSLILAILIGTFMYLRFLKITLFEDDQLLGQQQSWFVTLHSLFYTVPKTLVAIFADYHLKINNSKTIVYNTRIIDMWQRWLLTSIYWLLCFIVLFFFFFSFYSLLIFDLSIVLLTHY